MIPRGCFCNLNHWDYMVKLFQLESSCTLVADFAVNKQIQQELHEIAAVNTIGIGLIHLAKKYPNGIELDLKLVNNIGDVVPPPQH
jgi:hypothetical protein